MEKIAKTGLDIAIDQTIKIAEHLNPKSDKQLRENLIYSIFDDQLKAHTSYNRQQRHNAKSLLKKALKKNESK
jgi:hypothetical protein